MRTEQGTDIIVIGGGPAGLMAAGQAASAGKSVLLLEKMTAPGRKLRITGKGRCNLTNTAPLSEFIGRFGKTGKFLRQAFNQFFAEDLAAFFSELGVLIKTERGGRVFPEGDDAGAVADALQQWAMQQGVVIQKKAPVDKLLISNKRITGVRSHGKDYHADAVILATGGASYPGTGSTGNGYRLAESVGHTIVPVRPALVPLVTRGTVARQLRGLSLKNVKVTVFIANRKQTDAFGEMLFTHFGVSGPIILTLSGQVVDALRQKKQVELSIDLKPALDDKTLDARLLRDFVEHSRKQFATMLKGLLPAKLITICPDLVHISPDKTCGQITADERKRLRLWLKDFRLTVTGHRSMAEAIITAGGVDTREIDPHTMASRLIEGLYIAGELLDIDADTGGYNLQAAFSTGYVAGRAAAGHSLSGE